MKSTYRDWLEQQQYSAGTIQAQVHRAGRVEKHYGDLDEHYDRDVLQSVIDELQYTAEDERRNLPNPSKIPFNGDIRSNLASYRNAAERYCRFRREEFEPSTRDPVDEALNKADYGRGHLVGLERDLQAALRRSIEQLEPGLEIIDDGAERSVGSGFIDITARDLEGAIVVIELKSGTARQAAVAQILSYMGDVADEEPDDSVRGVLVAGDFDRKTRAAARMVPTLSLRSYRINFEFKAIDGAS
ncbi:MAG: endonuclease NucS [Bryobacterales bacterium]|nr:endonuclease NucS [Bryobacterales bacterium]